MFEIRVKNILIITIGNRDRGDDGLGPAVEEWLHKHTFSDSTRPVSICHGSGEPTALWDLWERADAVVAVDAFHSLRHDPGSILEYSAQQLSQSTSAAPFSTHGMGLLEAVQLGEELGKLPRALFILGVVGQDFAPFKTLSPPVLAALPDLCGRIVARVSHLQPTEIGAA